MKRYKIIGVLLLGVTCGLAHGQALGLANDYFSSGMYGDALPLYQKLYEKKDGKGEYAYKIAECYRYLNYNAKALMWYDSALVYNCLDEKLKLSYGTSLLREGRYTEAQKMLKQYLIASPNDERARLRLASCSYGVEHASTNPYFVIDTISSFQSNGYKYGVGLFQDCLVYSFEPEKSKKQIKLFSSDEVGHSQLYIAGADMRSVQPMKGIHKTGYSETGFTYDSTAGVGYTTRTSLTEVPSTQIVAYCYSKLFNRWRQPDKSMQSKIFRIDSAVCGDPFITQDGRQLYFSAVLPGGFGGSDIWYVERQLDGSWGQPINAGNNVNTAGNEVMPSLYDAVLYFSSNGHVGLGGFDIYACQVDNHGVAGIAHNLGKPINSSRDDMNLLMSKNMGKCFFVSNSKEGSPNDIYTFDYQPPHSLTVAGKVVDTELKSVSGAQVQINVDGYNPQFCTTNENGRFVAYALPGKEMVVKAQTENTIQGKQTLAAIPDMFGALNLTNPGAANNAVVIIKKIHPYGVVYDAQTHKPLSGAKLIVVENGVGVVHQSTDSKGQYMLNAENPVTKYIEVLHSGYLSAEKDVPASAVDIVQIDESGHLPLLDVYLTPLAAADTLSAKEKKVAALPRNVDKSSKKRKKSSSYDGIRVAPNGHLELMSKEGERADYIVQVSSLSKSTEVAPAFKRKVERLTQKQIQVYKAGQATKCYIGFYSKEEARLLVKMLRDNGVVDAFARLKY